MTKSSRSDAPRGLHREHPASSRRAPASTGSRVFRRAPASISTPDAAGPTAPTTPTTATGTGTDTAAPSGMFGRGLLYVVVWSLQLVAGTIVSPILAHVMAPAEFGALATAIALYQVLSVLALLGIDQAIVLQRAGDHDSRPARGLITVGIVVSLVVSLAVAVSAPLWREALGFGNYPTLVLAVVLWTAPGAIVQVMLALLLTEDRIRPFALISALAAVGGQVVGIVLLLTVHNDATTYAFGGVASQALAMVVGLFVTKPRLRGLINREVTVRAVRIGIPLSLSALAYFVLNAGDRVVIQSILGPVAVGRYQVAYVVGSVVILLLTFTSAAWAPRFAALESPAARTALAQTTRNELYRLMMPVILGITLGAPLALRLVAPASFRPESLLVIVFLIALTAFPVAASGASGRLLITLRRGKTVGAIAVGAAIVNLGLNLLLVPRLGIVGSALSTFASYTLLSFLQLRALPTGTNFRGAPWAVVRGVALCVTASALTLLLPQSLEFNIGRLVIALACLPWFLMRLGRARKLPQLAP